VEFTQKRRELQFAETDIAARITALQRDLDRQRAELERYSREEEASQVSSGEWENDLRRKRSEDGAAAAAPVVGKRRGARVSADSGKNGD
jgi:Skp family chaperone for outer membrane proteins